MATKREELDHGCFARAADDEPLFVLRAQDRFAPTIVRLWVEAVANASLEADNEKMEAKINEALRLAKDMERWQAKHGSKVPD